MSDTLQIFGQTFSNTTGIVATDNTDTERTFIRPTGTMTIDENGTYDVSGYASAEVSVSGGGDEPVPDDGKTRIWIHIADGTPDNRLTFYLRFTASVANNTTVDWGDGVSETLGSTTPTNYSHKYPSGGDYIITMTVNTGTISFEGTNGNSGDSIYGSRGKTNYYNQSRITRIIFGNSVTTIDSYACNQCYGLTSVTILDGVTSIGTQAFSYCHSLASVVVLSSVTVIASMAFYQCYSLESITMPDSITTLGDYVFNSCYSLTSLVIPNSVTSIGTYAFAPCNAISEFHFKPTTPPSVSNSNAFNGVSSDCIVYVPKGRLNAYKTATNFGNIASKMQEEPT